MIMKVDVSDGKIKVYDFKGKLDLTVGTEITIYLNEVTGKIEWSANNDDVLEINDNGTEAKVKALGEGSSNVRLIQDDKITYTIAVFVQDINNPVASLGASVSVIKK